MRRSGVNGLRMQGAGDTYSTKTCSRSQLSGAAGLVMAKLKPDAAVNVHFASHSEATEATEKGRLPLQLHCEHGGLDCRSSRLLDLI